MLPAIRALHAIAKKRGQSLAETALAWVLRLDNICAIPRSGRPEHVYENRAALAIHLDRDALAASLGKKGKIAWIYHDAQYYVTNQRDNASRRRSSPIIPT